MSVVTLTRVEQMKLVDCEQNIEKGLETFVSVGASLAMIREQKLYRDTHGTFEEYVADRWGWTASRARQLIGAAEVVQTIESVTPRNTPTTEAHARELVSVEPEKRAEVWQRAGEIAGDRAPTSDDVREAAGKPRRTRHGNGTGTGPRSVIPITTKKDGTIDKLATQRAAREAQAEAAVVDVKAEIRDVKREVKESPWGRLSSYLTHRIDVPPKLSREEIREAVTGDTDGGWYVTARVVRDFLTTVLEELDSAKEKEAKGAAS